ncbi:hypothetical protein DP129_12875 [Clostridium tetani]|uniref:cell wall-binding repeat-containing protein n=1 Tax=Clostridium tetani TaxID=1513 RepID=UPI00100ADF87|nr:cell wall-binding repeat-containing protein [Clostridium tetani]RXI37684.1 hypothetical protein DP129_12875 [Clostridium tetani]
MNKKINKKLAAFLVALSFLAGTSNIKVNAETSTKISTTRLSGANRYETSASISEHGWKSSDYAIIASGEGFADALCAAPLAKKYDAPILLTESKTLSKKTQEALGKIKAKNVIIVGGAGSVSKNAEEQINKLNIKTKRIYGKDRFTTSVEVAKEIGTSKGVVVTNGLGFADALSMAPIAANKQMPILLTEKENLPLEVKEFIGKSSYEKSYVIGGEGVVSSTVEKGLKNPKRLFGNSRYDTNAEILKEFFNTANLENIYLAAGSNYPDALSGSALASKTSSPIVLVSNKIETSVMSFIKDCKFKNVIILGGSAVVSDDVAKSIQGKLDTDKEIGNLKVNYINVGQGDSILIQQDGKNMLIDGGPNSSEKVVVDYLKSHGVTKLDYVIGTHPHEDHIGGLDAVINNFEIGQVFMPKATANTQTFKSVVTAINNKGLKITTPKVGESYNLGNAVWTILAPSSDSYTDVNNYSIVTKLKFGNNSFIFTGDAEDVSEGEILKKQLDISADVLKVGHHGSNSSTTEDFLKKVNPKYAVISVGKDNKYGHPTEKTLDKLKTNNISFYRTDEKGNIIATSNGNAINFHFEKSEKNVADDSKNNNNNTEKNNNNTVKDKEAVYITKTGEQYHKEGCKSLIKSKIAISLEEAKSKGYIPCKVCNP